jgi:hypothetical protein
VAKHHVIYIPGLADRLNRRLGQNTALAFWYLNGIRPHYFLVGWTDKTEVFEAKLQRLLGKIDDLLTKGRTVSLIGASAGASLAMVALHERSGKLNAVVSVCGKLNNPQSVAEPVFAINPAFKGSLERYNQLKQSFSPKDLRRVMSAVSAKDNFVPRGDSEIAGAESYVIPARGHILSILAALTIFRDPIVRFIKQQAQK